MKKLLSIMLASSLFLGFATNVFASASLTGEATTEDEQYAQGVQLIEEANAAIDAKIALAVEQADLLQKNYLTEIRIIEQSEIAKLESEKLKLEVAVASGKYSKSDVNEMKRKIAELEEKIALIPQRIETNIASITQDIEAFMSTVGPEITPTNEALQKAVEELAVKLNKKSSKYVSPTEYYIKKLNVVITDCYNVTLQISNTAIAAAATKGVIAECSWKLVRFGHLWVWIDPIRVVGRH